MEQNLKVSLLLGVRVDIAVISGTILVVLEASLHGWRDLFSPCPVVIVCRQVVAEALKENRTLKRLNLADNYIGVEGVQARRSDWRVGVVKGSGRRSWLGTARL